MTKLMNKISKKEEGFTLIELLVVILIIGILAAIAVSQFVGQQEKAGNVSAQADLSTAYKAAAAVRADAANNGVFPAASALRTQIVAIEPGLDSKLVATAEATTPPLSSTNPTNTAVPQGTIGWSRIDTNNVVFFTKSSNGNVYCSSTKTGASVRLVASGSNVNATCNA